MLIYSQSSFKRKPRKAKNPLAQKINAAKLSGTGMPSYNLSPRPAAEFARYIKSLVTTANCTGRKETLMYTGTLVKGIATMHKSNAVPVINEEQMKDISRMRRG